jgi:hypothetical protein
VILAALKHALVLCLLTGTFTIPNWLEQHLVTAIFPVAVDLEIADRREEQVMRWLGTIDILRERYRESPKLPRLAELERFPTSRDRLAEMISYNRTFRQELRVLADFSPHRHDDLMVIIEECDRLYGEMQHLRDAKAEYMYVFGRRRYLALLREAMGRDRFAVGGEIPFIPYWRLSQ